MTNNPYIGSTLDDLLEEDGTLAEVDAIAIKRVIAWQVAQAMESMNISRTEMSKRMNTSRTAVNRLLNPQNSSVTLNTMVQAASVVGKKLRIEFIDKNENEEPNIHHQNSAEKEICAI
jgi:antitoxin HicB